MAGTHVYVVQVMGGREEHARRAISRELGKAAEDCFTPSCELSKKIAEPYAERTAPEPPTPERLVGLEGIARSAIEASVGLADETGAA